MRLAITIGFKHGCGTPVVITGPEVPLPTQREAMRQVRCLPHHEDFQRIEVWDSSQGRILRKRLGAPGQGASEQKATGQESDDDTGSQQGPDAETDSQGAGNATPTPSAARAAKRKKTKN